MLIKDGKCDEARPACGKCVKAKRACSGYQEGLDLVLRDQNNIAQATVQRRQKLANKGRSASPRVPLSPTEDDESHALTFFVSSWVLFPHDPETDHGITELLPFFFGNLKSGTTLSLALTAVSRLMFAAWERRVRAVVETPEARLAYGKALAATRVAIEDPVQCTEDETLMAVLLLALYEVRVCQLHPQPSFPRSSLWH